MRSGTHRIINNYAGKYTKTTIYDDITVKISRVERLLFECIVFTKPRKTMENYHPFKIMCFLMWGSGIQEHESVT